MELQPLDLPEPGHLILDPLCLAESVLGREHRLCCLHPSLMVNTPCSLETRKSLGRLRASCRLELIGMPMSQAEISSSDSVPISLGSCLMEQWEQWVPWGTSSCLPRAIFLYMSFSITIKVNIYIKADINAEAKRATGGVFFRTENVQFQRSGSSANKCWLQSFWELLACIPTGSQSCTETSRLLTECLSTGGSTWCWWSSWIMYKIHMLRLIKILSALSN